MNVETSNINLKTNNDFPSLGKIVISSFFLVSTWIVRSESPYKENFSLFIDIIYFSVIVRLILMFIELNKNYNWRWVVMAIDIVYSLGFIALGIWNVILLKQYTDIPLRMLHFCQTYFLLWCLFVFLFVVCLIKTLVMKLIRKKNKTYLLKEDDPYFYK